MAPAANQHSFASRRQLGTLGIAPSLLEKLNRAGFKLVGDVLDSRPDELSTEAGMTPQEALECMQLVSAACGDAGGQQAGGGGNVPPSGGTSASDLLAQERATRGIVCFSRKIDDMFGGGVPRGELTEIMGTPGIGKTQFGMQLAVDVQIPVLFGGVGGEAVYIDTEGSFTPERVAQMADALVSHLARVSAAHRKKQTPAQAEQWAAAAALVTREYLLRRIHVFRVHDHAEQLAAVRALPAFVASRSGGGGGGGGAGGGGVLLVVLDSVAFHFRHACADMALRARMLATMGQQLNQLAREQSLAVVLTNQMTKRYDSGRNGEEKLVAALGDTWAHAATNRLMLFWKENQRFASLLKSSRREPATVPFIVDRVGIRDVPTPKVRPPSSDSAQQSSADDAKRIRLS
ncbi:Rad51-like protein c [Tribonema minus]|uniref:DNA repair protein RAD51 homolog 3 n=1 Tax=Tribonema minus TaxID=303371 RepID=A0A835ZD48_9STRA|nr:Rad51-like protein c [Tribonema minus]